MLDPTVGRVSLLSEGDVIAKPAGACGFLRLSNRFQAAAHLPSGAHGLMRPGYRMAAVAGSQGVVLESFGVQ